MSMVVCPHCGAAATGTESQVWSRCDACGGMVFRPVAGPRVLVAHESEEVCAQVGAVLLGAQLHTLRAGNGTHARRLLDSHQPAAVVLDVGLADGSVFEIIDYIRNSDALAAAKIVLLASVFNQTAYKRRPASLYGADDYVEQHHIPDMLPEKLRSLLGLDAPELPADIRDRVEAIRNADAWRELQGVERVRAVARSIVGDVALYHEADMAKAANGSVSSELAHALSEGRRVLQHALPSGTCGIEDPVTEAFQQVLAELRAKGGRHGP